MLSLIFAWWTVHVTPPLAPAASLATPVTYSLGAPANPWHCDELPHVDFRRFDAVYCRDAVGNLVKLVVEAVKASPAASPATCWRCGSVWCSVVECEGVH